MKEKTTNQKTLKIELIFALLAVLISLSTLFVYIYQSNLMKTQQKMSVWPHLTYGPSWGDDYLHINLTNKGIGPAIIKKVKIELNGQQLKGIQEIMSNLPDSINTKFSYSSIWVGQVIMAEESIQLFQTNNPKTIKYVLDLIKTRKIVIEICYCSVYNDCWTSYGL